MKRKKLRKKAVQYLDRYIDILKEWTEDRALYPDASYLCTRAIAASDALLEIGLITGTEQEFYEAHVRMLGRLPMSYYDFMEGRNE